MLTIQSSNIWYFITCVLLNFVMLFSNFSFCLLLRVSCCSLLHSWLMRCGGCQPRDPLATTRRSTLTSTLNTEEHFALSYCISVGIWTDWGFVGVGCDSLCQLLAPLPVIYPVTDSVDWLYLLQPLQHCLQNAEIPHTDR